MTIGNIPDANVRLSAHEQVCAIRYEGIHARLKRLEGILITTAGSLILMLGGVIVKMG